MRGRVLMAIFAAGLLCLVWAASAFAADQTVTANSSNQFTPANVTVSEGDTVTWNNTGGFHNVHFDDGSYIQPPSAQFAPWSVSRQFTAAGTFRYYCEIHGGPNGVDMSGTVTVTAAFPRPVGASPFRVSLVPTFEPCETGGANSRHGSPLNFLSCNAPTRRSSTVTIGSDSLGFVRMVVCDAGSAASFCNPAGGVMPKPDVRFTGSIRDVKCRTNVPAGCTAGADYNPNGATGPYTNTGGGTTGATPACFPSTPSSATACIAGTDVTQIVSVGGATTHGAPTKFEGNGVRITDLNNSPKLAATAVTIGFPVPMDCMPTTDPAKGSTCGVNTTANALAPGTVLAGKTAVWELGEAELEDSGPDGVRGNTDDQPFAAQGVFLP
jgi:plastocyanin